MTVTNRQLNEVHLTLEELNALSAAESALIEITTLFGSEGCLMSSETGECVDLSELDRVRAILAFFQDYRILEKIY